MTNQTKLRKITAGAASPDLQDKAIEQAKRTRLSGYGVKTADNFKIKYTRKDLDECLEALNTLGSDYMVPNFARAKAIKPERSGLFEVPYVRVALAEKKMYGDHAYKALYVKKEGEQFMQIGKEAIPYTHPVIAHEFIEDALMDLAESHKMEWEVVPEMSYDDKRGYRRYWAVLSKRFDKEIKGSFRKDDVVRVGALVRNGIAQQTSVGFDLFTFAVKCENGSIGRGEELGSESWLHIGDVKVLQERIQEGLQKIFKIGQDFIEYYIQANKIPMTAEMIKRIYKRTGIANRYFDDKYFELIPEKDNSKKIKDITLTGKFSLWEGYNALTAKVWHSDDMAFGMKAMELRKLNNELVQMVNTKARSGSQ